MALEPGNEATLNPYVWWQDYPLTAILRALRIVAMRLANIPFAAASGERNWSAFKRVWSDERMRLLPARIEKLVYV